MLRNYITVALRSIVRNKLHTGMNVTGLAVGMATCILIMLWVKAELSFDRVHQDGDHMFRLCHELTLGGGTRDIATGSDPMAPAIQAACPEVASTTRIKSGSRAEIVYGNNRFFEENILYADSQFFSVFTFPLVQGDARTALARANSVVITQDITSKYCGDQDPLGKMLRSWKDDYTVTGVIEKMPSNSHLSFELLRSYRSIHNNEGDDWWRWANLDGFTYMRSAPDARVESLEGKIAFVFSLLAVFVACLGLIGMASHAARRRTKEIGVRKVLGATTQGITILMTTELVRGLLIANIIAWPIAYMSMNRWLQTFTYRTSIGLGVFVLSGVLTLVLATATVGYHALKAARANPVGSLKYE